MKTLLPLMMITLSVMPGLCSQETPQADPAKLLELLSADDFEVRASAAAELIKLGEPARLVLEQGSRSNNPEVAEACRRALAALQQATPVFFGFDRDGRPLAGAEAELALQAEADGGTPTTESFVFDQRGTAKLKPRQPTSLSARVVVKNFRSAAQDYNDYQQFNLVPGLNPHLLSLTKGGTLKLRVADQAGERLKDVELVLVRHWYLDEELTETFDQALDSMLRGDLGADREAPRGKTDEKGEVKLESLPDGVYQVFLRHEERETTYLGKLRVRENETLELPDAKLAAKNRGKLELLLQRADGTPLKKTKAFVELKLDERGDPDKAKKLARVALYNQCNQCDQEQARETTDEGKLTLDELRPGRYRLHACLADENGGRIGYVRHNGDPDDKPPQVMEFLGEVLIEGAKNAVLTLKPTLGGTVHGRIFRAGGNGVGPTEVYLVPQALAMTVSELWGNDSYYYLRFGARVVLTSAEGEYLFRNVLPGSYVAQVAAAGVGTATVFGIEVTADKTAEVETITFPAEDQAGFELCKGQVILADGHPGAGVTVMLVGGDGQCLNSFRADPQGRFSYPHSGERALSIVVREPGMKVLRLDLRQPGLDLSNLVLRLEKGQYGKLLLRVVDEAGQPLSNVSVLPFASYNGDPAENPRRRLTNREGLAKLEGLAVGLRGIHVSCKGWYLSETPRASIEPDRENQLTVTLKRGLRLQGRVRRPPEPAGVPVLVYASTHKQQSEPNVVLADEAGHFVFEGLAPGEYVLRAVAPALVQRSPLTLILSTQPPAALPEICLEPSCAAAVRVPPKSAVRTLKLAPFNWWRDLLLKDGGELHPSDTVDQHGRAEFRGLPAGEYLVTAAAGDANDGYTAVRGEFYPDLILGTVTTRPLATQALAQAPAFELLPFSGSATLQLRLDADIALSPEHVRTRYACAKLAIVGDKAVAILSTNFSHQPERTQSLIQLGRVPAQVRRDSRAYSVPYLPAGEYRIYCVSQWMVLNLKGWEAVPSHVGELPPPIKTFVLKEGEALDLGDVKCPVGLPPAVRPSTAAEDPLQALDNDEVPEFQP